MTWFKLDVCCFALLLVTSFSVVLGNGGVPVHLAYECISIYPPTPNKLPVIFLHGLMDSKQTWGDIYEGIPATTNRKVCIYDARNHGDSSWNDTFDVDILAEDLGNFMSDSGIKRASLVGHSMGGLTIMKFALKYPDKVESIFVEDISPKSLQKEIAPMLKFFIKIFNGSLSVIPVDADEETATKAVKDYFVKVIQHPLPEHVFKKSPLRCKGGVWQWKSNFDSFARAIEDADSFTGKMEGQYDGKSFFIFGEESEFKVSEDKELIRKLFPKAEFFGVKGADHMVHMHRAIYKENLVKFLNSQNGVQG